MSFYARLDGGRAVSKRDLDTMIAMSKGIPIDWYAILTSQFREWGDTKSRNKVIGGGFFVAMIIKDEGCDLSQLTELQTKVVNWEQMRVMKMIKPHTPEWNYENVVPARMEKTMKRRADKRARTAIEESTDEEQEYNPPRDPSPPRESSPLRHPSPPPQPYYSSSIDERLARLEVSQEALGRDMRSYFSEARERQAAFERETRERYDAMSSFMAETRRNFTWFHTTLAGGFAHQGYTSFPPPPTFGNPPPTTSFDAPSSSNMFTTFEEMFGDPSPHFGHNQDQAPGPF